jgi:D-amino-acid oxidase
MSSLKDNPVVVGKDISFQPSPLKAPTASSPHVLVVGGGVTGLVTSWVLLDRGYRVTIVSKEWASHGKAQRLTSQIAGALWEYPPAVCGHHKDAISLHRSKRWSMISYNIFAAAAADPKLTELSGVRMKRSIFYFRHPIEDDKIQLDKMQDIQKSDIQGFKRDMSVVKELDLDPNYGVVDAYEHLAPIIDTDQAMIWLMGLVQSKGARLLTETIDGDLFDREDELRSRFRADVIINATGLGSYDAAGDKTAYPIRGGLIRVINDGKDFPKVTDALAIPADSIHGSDEIVFIVPRNDNILLIGGISEAREWNLDLTLESPSIKRMRARCEAFMPELKNARMDPDYPLAQGLRPFRTKNVRVERELRERATSSRPSRVIHSYGHGGAGWSLSFGCAGDVLGLVEEALQDLPPKAIAITKPVHVETVATQTPDEWATIGIKLLLTSVLSQSSEWVSRMKMKITSSINMLLKIRQSK